MQSTAVQIEVTTVPAPGFHLGNTLDSGQCFRWEGSDHFFQGVAGSRVLQAWQPDALLHFKRLDQAADAEDELFVRRYFDLIRDYAAILDEIGKDAAIAEAISNHPGIHILRQDPFETLISFIASSNNNIKRIRKIASLLSEKFGEPIASEDKTSFSFPKPERLADASLAVLRDECNLGFRDRYVQRAARSIAAGEIDLHRLSELDSGRLRDSLLEIDGVGEKVADCIMLFGYGRLEAFPVDTWIEKAMTFLYFSGKSASPRVIREEARKRFGQWAGVAQQYLFHSTRVRRALHSGA